MEEDIRCARGRLPSRPAIHSDEALDGYLKRLSTANGLEPAQLLRTLSTPAGTEAPSVSFLMIKPAVETVARISHVSGLTERAVRSATLMRFKGVYRSTWKASTPVIGTASATWSIRAGFRKRDPRYAPNAWQRMASGVCNGAYRLSLLA